jgi:hypothetical protein
LNTWHYPVQRMRRWCACTALGQYPHPKIHRYQVCMQTVRIRCKRQLCCANWHLHKKINLLVHVSHKVQIFFIFPYRDNMVISCPWRELVLIHFYYFNGEMIRKNIRLTCINV